MLVCWWVDEWRELVNKLQSMCVSLELDLHLTPINSYGGGGIRELSRFYSGVAIPLNTKIYKTLYGTYPIITLL